MAIQIQNLDLEEQEQLDQLKHFWKQWGNLISWVLIAVFGGMAAYNGWQYWQRNQAAKASALYDEVVRTAQAGDVARLERALGDMKDQFGRTTYAQQSALLAARVFFAKDKPEQARDALAWVADRSGDEGYRAVARLRLAGVQMQQKQYDDALKTLSAAFPSTYEALAADRRGDVLMLQGKKDEATAEYRRAFAVMTDETGGGYKDVLQAKLMAQGVDVTRLGNKPASKPAAADKGKAEKTAPVADDKPAENPAAAPTAPVESGDKK